MEMIVTWDLTIWHKTKGETDFYTRGGEAQVETMKGGAHNHNSRKKWVQNKTMTNMTDKTEGKSANLT